MDKGYLDNACHQGDLPEVVLIQRLRGAAAAVGIACGAELCHALLVTAGADMRDAQVAGDQWLPSVVAAVKGWSRRRSGCAGAWESWGG